eukprot:TRINITY_DN11465_c0_g1_i1.p1 TRINITY_DN11465_c0_g1~~TRINITY_DN11465_c0_g1_i1.p1  ORF type:complete len:412 (+),score=122.54 TRINITY_DN11465_c0_g1_i1:80-1237(+)
MVGWSPYLSQTASLSRDVMPGPVLLRGLRSARGRRLALLGAAVLLLVRLAARWYRRRRCGSGDDPGPSPPWVGAPWTRVGGWRADPIIAWLFENGGVLFFCGLRDAVLPAPVAGRPLRNFLLNLFGGFAVIETSVALQHIWSTRFFRDVPFFSPEGRRPWPSWGLMFKDWLYCNGIASLWISAGMALLAEGAPRSTWATLLSHPFRPLEFLKKLAIARVVVDLAFYAGHWAIHNQKVYKAIHKRHHEHYTTSVFTNFHFTPLDITIEAFIPNLLALTLLGKLGMHCNRFEQGMIFTYMNWYEIGSHTGKPIPTISLYAPLSPLYNELVDVDSRNIEFHERHHNAVKCNYGITQWVDQLLGTAQYFPEQKPDPAPVPRAGGPEEAG